MKNTMEVIPLASWWWVGGGASGGATYYLPNGQVDTKFKYVPAGSSDRGHHNQLPQHLSTHHFSIAALAWSLFVYCLY